MKVRWNANSLRLRITPSELAIISGGESVSEVLKMPGGARWQVRLQPAAKTRLFSEGQNVVVSLATGDCHRLAMPEAEGVYFQTEDEVRYFVEKDFPCVHPRAAETMEAPTETFDAPTDFERRKQEIVHNVK